MTGKPTSGPFSRGRILDYWRGLNEIKAEIRRLVETESGRRVVSVILEYENGPPVLVVVTDPATEEGNP